MIVSFLGTGTSQGVPVIACRCEVCTSVDYRNKRLRSSVLVKTDRFQAVIDTGPDFRQQMLRERVDHLDAALFTHAHKDHTAGLDDIRSFNFLQKTEIPAFGQQNTLDQLKTEFAYVFAEKKYPGIPRISLNTIDKEPFELKGVQVTPIEVMHHKLPVLGFRIGGFTYITDANFIEPSEKKKILNSDVLVINALQKAEHISHFTLDEALALIKEVKPQKAYLTHISHKLGLHAEVSKELPENVFLAYDGLKLEIAR